MNFRTVLFIPLFFVFLSGAAFGVHETLQHHYSEFKTVFPNANDQYWNPLISWTNKYKGYPEDLRPAFIGSKTWMAWRTDAKHLFSEISLVAFIIAMLGFIAWLRLQKRWYYIAAFFAIYLVRGIGFYFIYDLIF